MNDAVVLDMLSHGDLSHVVKIEEASFSLPWSRAVFADQLRLADHSWCIGLRDRASREIVGYAIFWCAVDEIHLMNIAISPSHRRRGYGDLLLRAVLYLGRKLQARRVVLEVRVSNLLAISLYEKYGFKSVVVRPRYYSDNGEDAYLMILEPVVDTTEEDLEWSQDLVRRLAVGRRKSFF